MYWSPMRERPYSAQSRRVSITHFDNASASISPPSPVPGIRLIRARSLYAADPSAARFSVSSICHYSGGSCLPSSRLNSRART